MERSPPNPFSACESEAYNAWRSQRLSQAPRSADEVTVAIGDPANLAPAEKEALIAACARSNMAFYRVADRLDETRIRPALKALAASLGLISAEDHRSADGDGIVAIQLSQNPAQKFYIPYSPRPLSWHTDGYYNYHGPENCIQGMLLHCVRDATDGGENAFFDPDIAYIRLRDLDPAFVEAMMHPQAMTIPPGEGAGRKPRPANTGPVFAVDSRSGALIMRFTERKRHIVWRDDPVTEAAVKALYGILQDDELVLRKRMAPGEGMVCNNVLHARTAFEPAAPVNAGRLLYRVRYRNRIGS
ncbi:MAG: TauD/TfdA family dioxygenase [Hyphomicrobiales bacterium]|nr:TauD/TfdA family dioxygenase [Hyphomicrobiales bacterium]